MSFSYRKYAGDTIVEVMIAVVVLGAALAGGFAITSKSQSTAQDNHERYQAQLYANQQAEWVKQYYTDFLAGGGKRSDFKGKFSGKICLNSTPIPTDVVADCLKENIYTVTVNLVSDATAGSINGTNGISYSILVTWDSISTGIDGRVELLYGL